MKAILVILLSLYCVYGYNDTIERKQSGANGAPAGDCMIQRITPAQDAINHLFWSEEKNGLLCTEEKKDTSHYWDYSSGKVIHRYLKEISGELMAFSMPIKNSDTKGIVASNQNIRTIQINNKDNSYNMSEPVITLKDKGYNIHTGHCDKDGNLYLVSNYKLKSSDPAKGSILYRVKDKLAEKIKQFKTKVNDFVFSTDYKHFYVIYDCGKIIAKYDFDMDNGKISNHVKFFNVTEVDQGTGCSMTSIEIDTKNNLWVTADDGLIMKIDPNGKVAKMITTQFCSLTAITFGGKNNKDLLVGSEKQCSPELQAGSILQITGLDSAGIPDESIMW